MRRLLPALGLALLSACNESTLTPDGGAQRCPTGDDRPEPGVVIVETGAVRGVRAGGVYAWKNIPYAAPPVGALRWRPPAEAACWSGVRDAAAFGPVCPQLDDTGATALGNEDCLTLNVWAPGEGPLRPVMVFIHGGGNVQGSASIPIYDGQYLVENGGVIVVTLQYRLGQFGFLAHPAFDKESPRNVSGNYGILDQIAALQWLQRNIARFGGDPAQIMIFGESAGGVNVCTLVASPLAKGLFHRALIQSGGCQQRPLATDETFGAQVVGAAGCKDAPDVAACMRALPADNVIKALGAPATGLTSTGFGPTVDGYVLPQSPVQMLQSGAHNQVPLVIGSNSDETSRMVPNVMTEQAYQAAVVQLYGQAVANLALPQYPVSEYGTPRRALVALTTDARFVCPSRRWVRAATSGQSAGQSTDRAVYRYFFTHALDGTQLTKALGAYHGLELFFVFHTFDKSGTNYVATMNDLAVSDAAVGYWTRFAKTGDPNGGGAPMWPQYAAGSDKYLQLDNPLTTGDGVRTAKCDFWDKLVP